VTVMPAAALKIDPARTKTETRRQPGRPDVKPKVPLGLMSPSQMRERIRLLEAVIDNFPGGLLLFDQELRLVLCNRQQKELLEYPDSLFSGGTPTLEQIFRFNAGRGEYGQGDADAHVEAKMDLVRKRCAHTFERTRPNGTVLQIRGVPLEHGGFVTTYLDVTEQRKNQSMIEHLAMHDSVTGLANRSKLVFHLQDALASLSYGEALALHYIDLDSFKPINDNHGHDIGDAILKSVAGRLLKCVRDTDCVARIGGDEFVVLQKGIRSAYDAEIVGNRIIKAVARSHDLAAGSFTLGASVGISLAPGQSANMDELIRQADEAMYRSKRAGGNKLSLYA
jgi:diguanylate cyclase (GGDEF)-like protein